MTSQSPADEQKPGTAFATLLSKYFEDLRNFFLDAVFAVNNNDITGDYVEFGSWGGKSLLSAHRVISMTDHQRRLWAFDSFEGLPEAADPRDVHPRWGAGGQGNAWSGRAEDNAVQRGLEYFQSSCEEMGLPRHSYTPVEGYFEDTLPPRGDSGEPRDIAIAYIDCNMYSSTVTVLDFLAPRLKNGMILAFDDYNCWTPDQLSGERIAVHEFLQANPQWRFRRFKDIHWGGVSFVVEPSHLLSDAR